MSQQNEYFVSDAEILANSIYQYLNFHSFQDEVNKKPKGFDSIAFQETRILMSIQNLFKGVTAEEMKDVFSQFESRVKDD